MGKGRSSSHRTPSRTVESGWWSGSVAGLRRVRSPPVFNDSNVGVLVIMPRGDQNLTFSAKTAPGESEYAANVGVAQLLGWRRWVDGRDLGRCPTDAPDLPV